MKRLVISLTTDTHRYKGHKAALSYICKEIAKFNGGWYHNDADKWIEALFKDPELKGIDLHHPDDPTYRFGSQKTNEYVQYGEIIKVNIL